MNPLLHRLASLRHWTRLLEGWRGVAAVFALVVGVATAAGLVDWALHLPSLVRAFILMGVLGGAGILGYRYLVAPLARPCDNLTLALRVEEKFPELNDALASTVQFLEQEEESPASGSRALRERAIEQTLAKAEEIDFRRILDTRGVYLLTVAAVLIGGTAVYFALSYGDFAHTAFWRLAEPFGRHTWTRLDLHRVQSEADEGDDKDDARGPWQVAVQQPFVLTGSVDGIIPAQAKLEIDGQTRTDKVVPIKRNAQGKGEITVPLDMTMQPTSFRFRVLANDGSFPAAGRWQEVEVVPPPRLVALGGLPSPQVELTPPAYTELAAPIKLSPGTQNLELLAGTNVTLRAAADRPLRQAWIEYIPDNPLIMLSAQLGAIGSDDPLPLLGQLMGSHAVWGRVPAQFEDERRTVFSISFMPPVSGTYQLHLRGPHRLSSKSTNDLRVIHDPVPLVKLARPGSSMTVLPDAEVAFHFRVEDVPPQGLDQVAAVRSVFIEYRRKSADGQASDEALERQVLYSGDTFGRAIPYLLARAARSPFVGPDLTLRPRHLDMKVLWPLRNQFKEGETVVVQVCGDDYCDIFGPREPGRSHEVELRIVGKFELAKVIDEKLAEAQQELVRLQKMHKDALDLVKDIAKKEKITQREIDQSVEAEQIEKQVRERVGVQPDEGLREKVGMLQQIVRDNKLTETEAQEQLRMLKGELDRLAQQELQQIEPQLAELRKELANAEKNAEKAIPDKKGPPEQKSPPEQKQPGAKAHDEALIRALKLQENAQKGLDELVKAMSPWANLQQIKAEARDIHNGEKTLQQDLEKMQADSKTILDGAKTATEKQIAERDLREKMNGKAEAQANLAKRTEELIDTMKKAQKKREDDNDKETAKRLQEATRAAEEGQQPLPSKMRDVAGELKNKTTPPEKALQDQEKAVEQLEKVITALEGKKEDVAERLQKKRKEARDELERLNKRMKDLEKEVQAANKIPNQQERLQKMQQLAKEHQQLKEDLEKHSRELARLQEQRASNDLNKAAEEVEKLGKKLQQGEAPPEEEQRDARDKVRQAKADFEESEEQLAREQLARLADKLKGLKERQDAALERTEEFQRKLMMKKFWSDDLADSVVGNAAGQRGIAKETQSLKEKLKDAKVFEHILDRAATAMDEASKIMEDRKKEGLLDREDGKSMDKEALDNESKRHDETVKYQKQAGRRLQHLLDAVKQELAKLDKEPPKRNNEEKKEGDEPEKKGPALRSGDGIPPVAQLKALRSEQLDVNQLTKEFAERHPDAARLTDEQRQELQRIQQDQTRLMELFSQMTAPAENKGDQP